MKVCVHSLVLSSREEWQAQLRVETAGRIQQEGRTLVEAGGRKGGHTLGRPFRFAGSVA